VLSSETPARTFVDLWRKARPRLVTSIFTIPLRHASNDALAVPYFEYRIQFRGSEISGASQESREIIVSFEAYSRRNFIDLVENITAVCRHEIAFIETKQTAVVYAGGDRIAATAAASKRLPLPKRTRGMALCKRTSTRAVPMAGSSRCMIGTIVIVRQHLISLHNLA
jgi:hypothetical protein